MTIDARFWSKVVVGKNPDECWRWTGATANFGYGVLGRGGRGASSVRAHRLSWSLHCGPIPPGLHVLHACDNPPCCNPAHLFLGTHQQNMQDAGGKGRVRPPIMRGVRNPSAKLTADDAALIRDMAARHVNQRTIAAMFGVTQALVSEIHRGRVWRSDNAA